MTKGTKKALIITGIVVLAGVLTYVGVRIYKNYKYKSGNKEKDERTFIVTRG